VCVRTFRDVPVTLLGAASDRRDEWKELSTRHHGRLQYFLGGGVASFLACETILLIVLEILEWKDTLKARLIFCINIRRISPFSVPVSSKNELGSRVFPPPPSPFGVRT
jgi:hypothetical protein